MTDVHVVTIREPEKVLVVARGHVMHQMGNEGVPQDRSVQGMHQFGAAEVLNPRYGRAVHTASTGYRR